MCMFEGFARENKHEKGEGERGSSTGEGQKALLTQGLYTSSLGDDQLHQGPLAGSVSKLGLAVLEESSEEI